MLTLGRKITIVVFLCIVAIEAVVLAFSVVSERDRLLSKIDKSLAIAMPLISRATQADASFLLREQARTATFPMVGLVVTNPGGWSVTAGDTDQLMNNLEQTGAGAPRNDRSYLDPTRNVYERYLEKYKDDSLEAYRVWVRFDVQALDSVLWAYIWKIIGLVALICVFVTAATLLALRPILLNPLLDLRDTLLDAQNHGLTEAKVVNTHLTRQDEIGDLYRAFDSMRAALTEAKESSDKLNDRIDGLTRLGVDCFWETDRHFRFTFVTAGVEALLGRDAHGLIGHSVMDLAKSGGLPIKDPVMCIMSLRNKGVWEGELLATEDDSVSKTIRIEAQIARNPEGSVTGVRGSIIDTTATSSLAREIAHQQTHDKLTGLLNRPEFERLLARKLSVLPSVRKPACVVVINLDRFKIINDACGHAAGDSLLKQIAHLLQGILREDDQIVRLNGDTFGALIDGCDLKAGLLVGEKIRAVIEQFRFRWQSEPYALSASIGIAPIDKHVTRNENVLFNADSACFRAKETGRNQIQVYDPQDKLLTRRNDEAQSVSRITQAIEEDRLVLFFQQIRPVSGHQPDYLHFEILLRMRTRDGQILPPAAFLPAAERFGLIERIDRWVVGAVLDWLSEQSIPPNTRLNVCVNLSGNSAADSGFQKFLAEAIPAAQINPAHLCFEVTETTAIDSLEDTAIFLAKLQALGCQIALDDFGTGFSSLEYIRQLPLDYIKIDGAFIKEIEHNKLDQTLVRCVSDVAHLLNVKTVAEFVENEATLALLKELRIDLAQGYHIAKPAPLPGIDELLALTAASSKASSPANDSSRELA
ncbi:MAG: putative bifunctional diguanylate cyclase/phosphodiesterase [Burkholderiaceae bacterium]